MCVGNCRVMVVGGAVELDRRKRFAFPKSISSNMHHYTVANLTDIFLMYWAALGIRTNKLNRPGGSSADNNFIEFTNENFGLIKSRFAC